MSSFDFSGAPTDQGGMGELIPDRTRVWAILTVRPFNIQVGQVLTPGKENPDNRYLDVELTVLDGPYARRKIWHKIGLAGSDKWVAQGMSAVRHILEVGREITSFKPGEPRYRLNEQNGERAFMELNELRCAVLVGVEKGNAQYPNDKNTVRAFLSPNPASNTNKDFLALVNGDIGGQKKDAPLPPMGGRAIWGGVTPADAGAPAARSAWGQPQTTQVTAAPSGGRPAWAAGGPPKAQDDPKNDIPF